MNRDEFERIRNKVDCRLVSPEGLTDLEVVCLCIQADAGELPRVLAAVNRALRESADGFPRQSMSDGGGSGQVPEVDERGRELKTKAPDVPHGDPTFKAVLARNEGHAGDLNATRSFLKSEEARVLSEALKLRRALQSAIGRARNLLEPPKEDAAALQDGVLGCTHHATIKRPDGQPVFEPIYEKAPTSGLCRWCWDHLRADGHRPPREALQIHVARGAREAGLWFARQEQQQKAG